MSDQLHDQASAISPGKSPKYLLWWTSEQVITQWIWEKSLPLLGIKPRFS